MSHSHSIYDTDPHFHIDPDTRVITNLSKTKPTIVQLDHKSERFTFEVPRFIENHDMSLCDSVKVHYINIGANDRVEDIHTIEDLQLSPDSEDMVICSWLITRDATSLSGTLSFAISFACTEDGEVVYAWSTLPYKDITIGQGINNSDAIAKEYADILQQWEEDLFGTSVEGVTNIYTARDASLEAIEEKGMEMYDRLYFPPITEIPTILESNKEYNFGEITELTLVFPTLANNGDVIYVF